MRPHGGVPARVLVMVNAARTPDECEADAAVLDLLRERGAALHLAVWDRGKVFFDLDGRGPVTEIEAINRWRLPQWLGHAHLTPLARLLRNARVRAWWRRWRGCERVVLLGPLRPEMPNYLPPGTASVGAFLGWRSPEPPESLGLTVELADRVLAVDTASADAARGAGVVVRTPADLLNAPPAPRRRPDLADLPEAAEVIVGLGPGDRRAAPELFLRVAAEARRRTPERDLRFVWLGLDPEDGRSFPYRFDAAALGLEDRVQWRHDAPDLLATLRRMDAVVLTAREAFAPPSHPLTGLVDLPTFLDRLDVPVVGFDTPAARALGGPAAALTPYPDVPALADALLGALDDRGPHGVDGYLDALVDVLVGPSP